ncbi:MAG: Rod shape-determining protein MreD, partial [uncultured Nocardioidaceae bacterium]
DRSEGDRAGPAAPAGRRPPGQLLRLLHPRRGGAEPRAARRRRGRDRARTRGRGSAGLPRRPCPRPRSAGRPRRRPLGTRAGARGVRRGTGASGRASLHPRRAGHRRCGVLPRDVRLRAERHGAAGHRGRPHCRAAGRAGLGRLRPPARTVRPPAGAAAAPGRAAAEPGRVL